ncbi:MAG: serine/threonine protein kinase [Gemmataceae bacterium]|nr:serine/threonine protein kinase [Gemmataceae bacterium]MCI0742233.1 serine/threonine protein kinase [Gemmataceae bacterium]
MIGDRLGKWAIFKELGHGGMGRVYLAQEEMSGRQAAIKVLAPELAQEAGFLQRFQREIESLSLLDHPGIVRFMESGCENGLYYYAMEYVEGQSLDEILLTQGRLPWREVLDIALQICPALRHVHDHGIIHRDIKPPNILRTADGKIKITDFGIAKVFASAHLTKTGGVVGTAEFLSPEQAAGKPVSKRSDLYSLGIVLYTLLTGRLPFEGASFVDLLHKHRYGQFDRPQKIVPEIPYEIDEVVCLLLEKDPEKRPPDCQVLGRHLESVRKKLERKGHPTAVGVEPEETVAESKTDLGDIDLPGPATLMSKLMRAELKRQSEGPLSGILNRAWVLLLLLGLCVGVIAYAFWPPSMETLYARGSELMGSERLADQERAWREYLGPLNERFPDNPYKDEVEKLRLKFEAAKNPGPTEAQRFYLQGERLLKEGDWQAAKRVWQNLVTVFQDIDAEKHWVHRAEKSLVDADKQALNPQRWKAVQQALVRAAQLRDQDRRAEAEAIWRGLEELYRNDPLAADVMKQITTARKK